jgi:hypothetical protein
MDNITFLGSLLTEADKAVGKYPVKVIQPGWGSSGYYSETVSCSFCTAFRGCADVLEPPKVLRQLRAS